MAFRHPDGPVKLASGLLFIYVPLAALFGYTIFRAAEYGAYWSTFRKGGPHSRLHWQTGRELRAIAEDLKSYRAKHGNYPTELDINNLTQFATVATIYQSPLGLNAKVQSVDYWPPRNPDPKRRPVDCWSNPYNYQPNETDFVLYTMGSDGAPGGTGLAADLYLDGRVVGDPRPSYEQYRNRQPYDEYVEYKSIFIPASLCAYAVIMVWAYAWIEAVLIKKSSTLAFARLGIAAVLGPLSVFALGTVGWVLLYLWRNLI